jgi:putative endonuclease
MFRASGGLADVTTARTGLGRRGEEIARQRLEADGWRFIRRNWHCAAGELDLIMLDGREIVFVEVKTRRTDDAGPAEESVSRAKGRKLMAAAQWYLAAAKAPDLIWRIDIVAITLDESGRIARFTHLKNAVVTG